MVKFLILLSRIADWFNNSASYLRMANNPNLAEGYSLEKWRNLTGYALLEVKEIHVKIPIFADY